VSSRISQLKASQRQLEALASSDALTGLPNRRVFDDRLEHAIQRILRTRETVALLFVDLDGFKHINDTYGHDVGDKCLQKVAARLQSCVRRGDSLCRLGGDEFVAILEGGEPSNDATYVAERIVETCRELLTIGNRTFRLSASVGVAISGRDGDNATSLLRSADHAMYVAKRAGGSAVSIPSGHVLSRPIVA